MAEGKSGLWKRIIYIGSLAYAGLTNPLFFKFLDWIGRIEAFATVALLLKEALSVIALDGIWQWVVPAGLALLVLAAWLNFKLPAWPRLAASSNQLPPTEDERPETKFLIMPPPNWDEDDGFNYPYPKAVLQAKMGKEHGTAEARAGEEAHRLTIVMAVENKHTKPLRDCSAIVTSLTLPNGKTVDIGLPLTGGDKFDIDTRRPKHLPLLMRDISDKVTPEPFLLRTAGPGTRLKEGAHYLAHLELRSAYPHPTKIVVQINTGRKLAARAAIISQGLESTLTDS